jgi:P-type Cu+ transporter
MEESFGLKDYSHGEIIRSRDPVCGAIVEEEHSAGKAEYAGEIYYFCSAECKRRFEEDPGEFIGLVP